MIDVAMFAELAAPGCRVFEGSRPPLLEEVFARVVHDGWVPRSPAYGAELERLEVSTAFGVCLEPLIVAGDEVYIDHSMPPQPGDIVSFELSERGAQANTTAERVCRKGDRWLKLYVPFRGVADMLLEKYGNSATATLMACEHPDDAPRLAPVRNIRRNGKLLFTPESLAAEIELNAATDVSSTYVAGPVIAQRFIVTDIATLTIGPYHWDTEIVITVSGYWNLANSSGSSVSPILEQIITNGGTGTTDNASVFYAPPTAIQNGTTAQGLVTQEATFTLAANTTTTYKFQAATQGSPGTTAFTINGLEMKGEAIKR